MNIILQLVHWKTVQRIKCSSKKLMTAILFLLFLPFFFSFFVGYGWEILGQVGNTVDKKFLWLPVYVTVS